MTHTTRIRLAAATTTLFLGGLTALGIALGPYDNQPVSAQAGSAPGAEVMHRRDVRTVGVNQAGAPGPSAAEASAAPVGPSVAQLGVSPTPSAPRDEPGEASESEEDHE